MFSVGDWVNGVADRLAWMPFYIPAFIIALSVHEWAHAFVAYCQGDPTAKERGRLTLNPLPHIDPLGLVVLVLCQFGWARPVPIDASRFHYPRVGSLVTSLAGPLSNVFLALLGYFLWLLPDPLWWTDHPLLQHFIAAFCSVNVMLMIFNMLPIPPLDGYRVVKALLPLRWGRALEPYEMLGALVMVVLIFIPGATEPLGEAQEHVARSMQEWVQGMIGRFR